MWSNVNERLVAPKPKKWNEFSDIRKIHKVCRIQWNAMPKNPAFVRRASPLKTSPVSPYFIETE
jgi:hypothetical protein